MTLVMPVPAPKFCVTTAGKRVIFHKNVEESSGKEREWGFWRQTDGGYGKIFGRWQEVLKTLVPEAVFPRELR